MSETNMLAASNTPDDVIDLDIADFDEKEHAFITWMQEGRNVRKTHDITGIPLRTLQDWVTRYGWRERWRQVIDGVLAESVTEVRLAYSRAMHTAAQRLLTDIANPDLSPSDVRHHVELLMKVSQGEHGSNGGHGSPTFIDARSIQLQPNDVRPVDPRTLATQAIEANIKDNEVRKVGRRGSQ